MKVKDLMTKDPLVAEVPGNRNEVLRSLVEHAVSGMPVVKARSQELVGVITRSDIFRQPEEEQTALIMSSDPFTITPDADVGEAARLFFEHRIHGLPVVSEEGSTELVGVISPTDILRMLTEEDGHEVEEFITRSVNPVYQETPLPVVWEIMNLTRQNALPVLDDKAALAGIVVDSDLFKHNEVEEDITRDDLDIEADEDWAWERIGLIMPLYYAQSQVNLPSTPVKDIMVQEVVTVFRKSSVGDAAAKMAKHHINQLPVLDSHDKMMGMVTDLDLMQAVMD